MLSRELLSGALGEFLNYSVSDKSDIVYTTHEVYDWDDNDRVISSVSAPIPAIGTWSQDLPDDTPKVQQLFDEMAEDKDIPLIQSESSAGKAFERLVREIRIETNRGDEPYMEESSDFYQSLHSEFVEFEAIAPIIGIKFNTPFSLDENLEIRLMTNFEKELVLNKNTRTGGSLAVHRAIKAGALTHVAEYTGKFAPKDGWDGGMTALSAVDSNFHQVFEDLKIAIRLTRPESFQMETRYSIDRTFYPVIFGTQANHGVSPAVPPFELDVLSDHETLSKYYSRVRNVDQDEGLRVAIERLDSSFKKISNSDAIVDAVIGIEALLSSGPGGSFRDVRRRAAILSGDKSSYSELGELQNLRNSTVHGEETYVDNEQLNMARDLLSLLIGKTIDIHANNDISREDLVDELDFSMERVMRHEFERAVSEFDPD